MKEDRQLTRVTEDDVIERLKLVLKEFDYKENIWFDYEMITKEVKVFNYKYQLDVCTIYNGKITYLDEEDKYRPICERLRDVIEEIKEEINSTEELFDGECDYLNYVE